MFTQQGRGGRNEYRRLGAAEEQLQSKADRRRCAFRLRNANVDQIDRPARALANYDITCRKLAIVVRFVLPKRSSAEFWFTAPEPVGFGSTSRTNDCCPG